MEMKTAVAKLNKAIGKVEPEEVVQFNTERATSIVNAIKQIDEATAEVVGAVALKKKGLEKELRQHKRQMEKLFSGALPEKKSISKEHFSKWGLKNWQVEYVAAWNDAGFTGVIKTREELRKAAGAYSKTQFQKRISSLVAAGLLRTSADGTLIVNKLDAEVLSQWQLLNK